MTLIINADMILLLLLVHFILGWINESIRKRLSQGKNNRIRIIG